ncbi:MAG: hypothetical protein JNL12_19155 [Planctomycetes bacterium]|nr:hypothetical protein [Planctomycetota bacterium]
MTHRSPRRRNPGLVGLVAFAACATTPPMPELPPTHPASPHADAAPELAPSTTLQMPVRVPRGTPAASGQGPGHRR